MRMTIASNSTAEIPELMAIKEYSLIELPAPGRPSGTVPLRPGTAGAALRLLQPATGAPHDRHHHGQAHDQRDDVQHYRDENPRCRHRQVEAFVGETHRAEPKITTASDARLNTNVDFARVST